MREENENKQSAKGQENQGDTNIEKDQDIEGRVPDRKVWVAVLSAAEEPDRMRT